MKILSELKLNTAVIEDETSTSRVQEKEKSEIME